MSQDWRDYGVADGEKSEVDSRDVQINPTKGHRGRGGLVVST